MASGYEAYKKTDVNTASQGKLIVMLYDGAIRFCQEAIKTMNMKGKIEETHTKLVKAQDIITELHTSLNYDAGDIANKLASIYLYMNKLLTQANVEKKKEPVEEVISHLQELKSAWDKVAAGDSPQTKQPPKDNQGGGKLNIAG